jgi:metal-responsive CopG/Arc/MetJ family transcriptional regulator
VGADEYVGLRLPAQLLGQIDTWTKRRPGAPSRSNAIRHLLAMALKGGRN